MIKLNLVQLNSILVTIEFIINLLYIYSLFYNIEFRI